MLIQKLLKGEVAQIQNWCNNGENTGSFSLAEVAFELIVNFSIFLLIDYSRQVHNSRLIDIFVLLYRFGQEKLFLLIGGCAFEEIVEYVVISLSLSDWHYSAFLQ